MTTGPIEYHTDSWFILTAQEIEAMRTGEPTEYAALKDVAQQALQKLANNPAFTLDSAKGIKAILDAHREIENEEYQMRCGLKTTSSLKEFWAGKSTKTDFEFGSKLYPERPARNQKRNERGASTDAATSQMMMLFQNIDAGTYEFVNLSRRIRVLKVMSGVLEGGLITCSNCMMETRDATHLHLFITCGHVLCGHCEKTVGKKQSKCPIQGCNCISQSSLFACRSLLSDATPCPEKTSHMGVASPKVQAIVDTINGRVPKDEKVLLFVSNPTLKTQLHQALRDSNLTVFETKGDDSDAKAIRDFKQHKGRATLLQTLMSSESAGTNLTEANHVMYAAPLHTDTRNYYMFERQARGRAIRFGQTREVFVYHFVTAYTIEVDIFQHRFRQKLKNSECLKGPVTIDTERRDAWTKQLLFGGTVTVREQRRSGDPVMVTPFDIGQPTPSAMDASSSMQNGLNRNTNGEDTLTKLQKWLARVDDEMKSEASRTGNDGTSPSAPDGGKDNKERSTDDIGSFLSPEQIRKLLCSEDFDEWQDELVVESSAK